MTLGDRTLFERPSTATTGSDRGFRWLVGVVAGVALLLGAVSCSSDDAGSETGRSMELTPSSDDIDDAGDAGDPDGADGSDGEADGGSGDGAEGTDGGGSEGPDRGPVEPLELSSAEEAYRDELLAAIDVDGDDAGFDMECLAGRWIRSAGLDRLEGAGVTPEVFAEEGPTAIDLSRDEALEFVLDYERCGMDLYDFIFSVDIDPVVRACITDALDRDDLEDYVVLAILGLDDEAAAMQDQISASTAQCNEGSSGG